MSTSTSTSTSTISINFQNTSLTTNSSVISVLNGAFALDTVSGLSLTGAINFSTLYVTSGAINFNVASGTVFNATVVAPVSPVQGTAPVLEITNFAGNVTVTWPTATGPHTQMVMSGDPITLNGFVG